MSSTAIDRCRLINDVLHRVFGAPVHSSQPRKHAREEDSGITAFLKTYCFTRRLNSAKGASGTSEMDPKALGTIIHDQLALWAPKTRTTIRAEESARIRSSFLPQTRKIIEHFESKRFILLTANLLISEPTLCYDTPIDLLAVDASHLESKMVRLLLVELKTTRRRACDGGNACVDPIGRHLRYETAENYARMQATLPAIRMNEVLTAHQHFFQEKGFTVHVIPYIVFLRMGDRDSLTIDEYVAPLEMQTTAFRNSLVSLMSQKKKK